MHRDRYAYAEDRGGAHEEWDDDWDERPRKGVVRRAFSLLKLAVFLGPLAFFAYGYVADCRAPAAFSGWLGFVGAGACARNEILGSAASMPDNLAVLRRLIN
jgi:hypothetical protein